MALLHLEARPVETSGIKETRAFTMKANGKAFKVLIDGLYSDKVRATIRELWSNAYDSHVAAGCADRPFESHLPTEFDPYFSVRDYGTSMTHDEVMGLYTTVFESSKEDSSTQVGKLGLGSKSPFAYNDTFTVTAWKDGEKRTYSAYIGADYIPQIALMNSEPSDEEQGLEVSFPVRSADFYAFRVSASGVAVGFDVPPIVTGAEISDNIRGDRLAGGDNWAIYENLRGPQARQGCVVYPIDLRALGVVGDDVKAVLESGILIDFPIGDLEISASRESLGYDATTICNITDAAQKIYVEMRDAIEEALKGHLTIWDKMVYLHSVRQTAPRALITDISERLFGRTGGAISWDVPEGVEVLSLSPQMLGRKSFPKRPDRPSEVELDGLTQHCVCFVDTFEAPVATQWVRLRHWFETSGNRYSLRKLHIVRYNSGQVGDIQAQVEAAFEGAPDDTFFRMADLPMPPKAPRAASVRIKVRQLRSTKSFHHMHEAEIDVKAGGYFVQTTRGKTTLGEHLDGRDLATLKDRLVAAGLLSAFDEVYIVPQSYTPIRHGKNGWKDLVQVGRSLVDHYLSEATQAEYAKKHAQNRKCIEEDVFSALPTSHPLRAYVAETMMLQITAGPTAEKVCKLGRLLAYRPWEAQVAALPEPVSWEVAAAAYPLLRDVHRINSDNKDAVLDYVNLIDSRQRLNQAAA